MALNNPDPRAGTAGDAWLIRPSWASLGRWELHVLPIASIGLVLAIGKGLRNVHSMVGLAGGLAAVGIALGIYAIWLTLYMLSTSITVWPDALVIKHWFRSKASVQVSDISRVVRCSVGLDHVVLAFSSTGRCVMSLHASRWDDEDLERIWARIGVKPEGSWKDEVREQDLKQRFPGAF